MQGPDIFRPDPEFEPGPCVPHPHFDYRQTQYQWDYKKQDPTSTPLEVSFETAVTASVPTHKFPSWHEEDVPPEPHWDRGGGDVTKPFRRENGHTLRGSRIVENCVASRFAWP